MIFQSRRLSFLNASFYKYLFVGIVNTGVGLGLTLVLFNAVALGYWTSTFIGNAVGAIVSYILNRKFTFQSSIQWEKTWWKFFLVVVLCYVASYRLCQWLFEMMENTMSWVPAVMWHNGAILAGSALYTITGYLGHKYFTFREKHLHAK
jgi:putative flippase GtrA